MQQAFEDPLNRVLTSLLVLLRAFLANIPLV